MTRNPNLILHNQNFCQILALKPKCWRFFPSKTVKFCPKNPIKQNVDKKLTFKEKMNEWNTIFGLIQQAPVPSSATLAAASTNRPIPNCPAKDSTKRLFRQTASTGHWCYAPSNELLQSSPMDPQPISTVPNPSLIVSRSQSRLISIIHNFF